MDKLEIKYFVESALLAAGRPLSVDQLQKLFDGRAEPEKSEIREAIQGLVDEYEGRGITVAEVASGFRIQVKASMADRLQKLWEERPPRYSRALFERWRWWPIVSRSRAAKSRRFAVCRLAPTSSVLSSSVIGFAS